MEKEELWGTNWQPGDGKAPPEANFSFAADNQLPQRFLNLNRKQRTTYDADFELAVPSLMSSTTSNPPSSASGAVIGELIGRLGSIHNSGKISPSCGRRIVANTALYTTALNSPPKPTLSVAEHRKQGLRAPAMPPNWMPGSRRGSFSPDVGFADGTAALASFGELGLPQTGNAARLSSSNANIAPRMEMEMSSKFGGYLTSGESEIGHKRLESSLCDGNAGKRKAGAKRKAKEAGFSYSATSHPTGMQMMGEDSSDAKRCKIKAKMEQNSEQEQGKNGADKSTEPSKDYVHVRARRGQATDSHSLAERVRREKISKRMKFLQDLVPGCSKVTGKAVMLDEIINYVQSLQWQVEFLSMKLATLKPQLGPNMGNLAPEDVHRAYGTMLRTAYPAEIMSKELSYAHQSQTTTGQTQDQVESSVHQSQNMHLAPIDGYEDLTSQLGNFWGDELQSVAQMGFDQYQDTQHSPPKFSMAKVT